MTRSRMALAAYRLARAREAFRAGLTLVEAGSYLGAINRFYYAAFYAAKALLVTKGIDSSKHSGVIALFQQHFVKTGLLDSPLPRPFRVLSKDGSTPPSGPGLGRGGRWWLLLRWVGGMFAPGGALEKVPRACPRGSTPTMRILFQLMKQSPRIWQTKSKRSLMPASACCNETRVFPKLS